MQTMEPRLRTYSLACWNGFSWTASMMTAWAPRPSGVAFLTSRTRSLDVVKSTYVEAPSLRHMSPFSAPPSTAMMSMPMARAYWMAMLPRPPPAPTTTTLWPARAPDSFSPLYTVMPAHRIGATASSEHSFGIRATCEALPTAYCWKLPSTVYPDSSAEGQSGSLAVRQKLHVLHELLTVVGGSTSWLVIVFGNHLPFLSSICFLWCGRRGNEVV